MTYSFVSYSDTQVKLTEDSREYIYKKVYCTTSVDGDYFIFSTHNAETGLMMQQYKLLYTDCSAPSESSASALKTAVDAIINSYVGGGGIIQNTVYVASYGNDGTAVIGDMFQPYLTLQGALDAGKDALLSNLTVVALTSDADTNLTTYDIDSDYPYYLEIDYWIVSQAALTVNGSALFFGNAYFVTLGGIILLDTADVTYDDILSIFTTDLTLLTTSSLSANNIECANFLVASGCTLNVNNLTVKGTYSDSGTINIGTSLYRTVQQGTVIGNTLRWNGSDWVESGGAGLMKSSTFTAPNPIAEYSTNIVDADCLTTSTIIISHSPTSETDANSDEVIGIRAYPLNGSFTLIAQAVTSKFLNGTYKFNYIIK